MNTLEQAFEEYRAAEAAFNAASQKLRKEIAASDRHAYANGVSIPGHGPVGLYAKQILAIIEASAYFHDVTVHDIIGRSKLWELVAPRHRAMVLCVKLTKATPNQLGRAFGDRTNGSILHACRAVEEQCDTSPTYAQSFAALERICREKLQLGIAA